MFACRENAGLDNAHHLHCDDLMTPHEKFLNEVRGNIDSLGADLGLREASTQWIIESAKHKYSYNFAWMGRPIIQYPQDIVAMQELIWRVQPDLIIETGIAHGGSLIFNASMLALLDYCATAHDGKDAVSRHSSRRVVGIDIEIRPHNRLAVQSHPLASLITMIEGSSVDPAVISSVKAIASEHQNILICLDSNHTADHVLAELTAYAPLVSPDSYCVVFDTVIENMSPGQHGERPWGPGNNPMTAVDRFLASLVGGSTRGSNGEPLRFEIDEAIDSKLLISVAPRGYLRRVPTDEVAA
jgi:Cephalosporin hydroxylase